MYKNFTCIASILLQFICINCWAQSDPLSFKTSGELISIQHNKKLDTALPTFFERNAKFKAKSNEIKKEAREILINKIEKTIDILDAGVAGRSGRPEKDLLVFLESYYGTSSEKKIYEDLEKLLTYLKTDTKSEVIGLHYLQPILKPINSWLLTSSPAVYSLTKPMSEKGAVNIRLLRQDPSNSFMIDYYNNTITDAISSLTQDKISHFSKAFERNIKVNDSFSIKYREMLRTETVSFELLKAIIDYDHDLRQHEAYTWFKDKMEWFLQWFWLRGGKLSLNPLDFTSDLDLKRHSVEDTIRAKLFDQYIDKILENYLQYDTFGRVSNYKEILTLKDTGKELFSQKAKIQKLTDANNALMVRQLMTVKCLNRVDIPISGDFYSLSTQEEFTTKNNHKYLINTISEGDSKTIVIYNIPKGTKGGLLSQITASPDVTGISRITDTIGGLLAQIAGLAIQTSPYAPALNMFNKSEISNRIIPTHNFSFGRVGPPSLLEHLKRNMDAEKIWDEETFTAVKSKSYPRINLEQGYIPTTDQKDLAERFLKAYLNAVKVKVKNAGISLSTDSLQLAFLFNINQNASLPPKKLTPLVDEEPLYYTGIFNTDASNSSTTEKITPYVTKGEKDTVKFKSFEYERGKHFRFQLSAGIAYTTANITQSEAKVQNGKVAIKNTSQQYQFSVGVHIHWGKGLVLKDDRLFGNFFERSSAYVGVGIPEPLGNVYLGYSYDFFPGLKTILGMHCYRKNDYMIENNTIVSERLKYKVTFPFFAVQIDPAGFLKALKVIKPN